MFSPVYTREMNMLPVYVKGTKDLLHQNKVERNFESFGSSQVMLCTSGAGTFINHNQISFPVQTGDLIYFMSKTPHAYYPSGYPWSTKYIVFGGVKIESLMAQAGFARSGVISTGTEFDNLNGLFDQVLYYHYHQDEFSAAYSSMYLYQIITTLSSLTSQDKLDELHLTRDKLKRVISIIETQYFLQLSLPELADEIHVTPEHLTRLFRAAYDTTPIVYLNQIRIENAKKMLYLYKDKKIKEIAMECGFMSPGYFSKVFKRMTGYLPEEFRKIHIYTRYME